MAKKAAVEGFDDHGQPAGTPKGEVDELAVQALQEALPEEMPEEVVPTTGDPQKDAFLRQLQDPEIRKAIGLPPLPGLPLGEWNRNYDDEEALKVYGGVEVKHPPGFCPDPPAYIPKYVAPSGRTTNHKEDVYTPGGQKMYEGALKDSKGNPVKSNAYKAWLDKAVLGQKLDGRVKFDIIQENANNNDLQARMPDGAEVATTGLMAPDGGITEAA